MAWSEVATVANLISLAALVVALLALLVSYLTRRDSRRATDIAARAEKYDYAVRLQVRDERNEEVNGPVDLFRYSATLVNGGLKPVRIDRVYVDYGGETLNTSRHFVIEGVSDIPPDGERQIRFSLRKEDYEGSLTTFGIEKCFVRLRVRYVNADGTVAEAQRPLYTRGPGTSTTVYAQRGDALT